MRRRLKVGVAAMIYGEISGNCILASFLLYNRGERRMIKRGRGQVNAFNLVPVIEQVLPDRPKTEVCVIYDRSQLRFLKGAHSRSVFYLISL